MAVAALGAGGAAAAWQREWPPFATASGDRGREVSAAAGTTDSTEPLTSGDATSSTTVTTGPSTTATTAPPSTTAPAVGGEPAPVAGVHCSSGGDGFQGMVSGVQDWVMLRSSPALDAPELQQVTVRSPVVYFPDSFVYTDEFEWTEVSVDGRCGWMTSKFVKDTNGRVVGSFDAIDYVHRALRGLEPEALHARVQPRDPGDPLGPEVPFNDADLQPVVSQLRQLYLDDPTIDSAADPRVVPDPTSGVPGCTMADYQHCGVVLTRGTGEAVAYVQVSFVGDGVTSAVVELV